MRGEGSRDETRGSSQQGDDEDGANTARQGDLEGAIDGDAVGRAGQWIDQLAERRRGRVNAGGRSRGRQAPGAN